MLNKHDSNANHAAMPSSTGVLDLQSRAHLHFLMSLAKDRIEIARSFEGEPPEHEWDEILVPISEVIYLLLNGRVAA